MTHDPSIDGVLIQWGERLFYPPNRIVKSHTPRLSGTSGRAADIRSRIEATVRRAPQVMIKVTGGGRGMAAIAAHFRYISKNGRLDLEDDRGVVERGKDSLHELERQWRFGGAYIGDVGHRHEAFNVMLSMPRGTDPLIVQRAAREFAKIEFADHRYVMVLHDHQANPHVHLSVKVESKHGQRLNPRKADLQCPAGMGRRCRRDAAGDKGAASQLSHTEANEGSGEGSAAATGNDDEVRRAVHAKSQAGARIVAAHHGGVDPIGRAGGPQIGRAIKQYVNEMPFAIDFARSVRRQASGQRELSGMREVMMPKIERSGPGRELER